VNINVPGNKAESKQPLRTNYKKNIVPSNLLAIINSSDVADFSLNLVAIFLVRFWSFQWWHFCICSNYCHSIDYILFRKALSSRKFIDCTYVLTVD